MRPNPSRTNSCGTYTAQILAYLEGRLDGDELARFCCHIKRCAECAQLLAEEQALTALLRSARPLYTAPPDLRAKCAAAREGDAASARPREGIHLRAWRAFILGSGADSRNVTRFTQAAAAFEPQQKHRPLCGYFRRFCPSNWWRQ